MAEVIMPQMGESIVEGTITKWLKQVGDRVQRDEPLFEISTDKVDAEIPAPSAGYLREIRFQPGDTVAINTVVAVITAEPPAMPTAAPQPAVPASAAMPESMFIAPDDLVVEPAPVRPAIPAVAPLPPAVTVPPSPRPALAAAPTLPPTPARPATPVATPRSELSAEQLRQSRSSPVVRKIAAEHGVDVQQISGTGLSGRVTKQDILAQLGSSAEAQKPLSAAPAAETVAPTPPAAPASAPNLRGGERIQIVPMSPIRKKTAEHMVLSQRISAHVHTVFEIDLSRVEQLRAKYRDQYHERSGIRLGYLPFILKASIDALKAFPVLNSSVEGEAIVYRQDINLGIAVALDWGLIVPVIRNADEKNVLGLARAVADLAERARAKKLKVEEVQGGTFTVTDPGVFGSLFGTPIINQPQVAILGVGTIEKRPIIRDDAIAIRTMAYFALTFDHRVIDGAEADRFMTHFKKSLQEFDESAL